MKSTGMISQLIKLVNERIKNQAACGRKQLVETDLCCRGTDFPASIKVWPKLKGTQNWRVFLHAECWDVHKQNNIYIFFLICISSFSGIRSLPSLMLYALLFKRTETVRQKRRAYPVPGCSWEGSMEGAVQVGELFPQRRWRCVQQPGSVIDEQMHPGVIGPWNQHPSNELRDNRVRRGHENENK